MNSRGLTKGIVGSLPTCLLALLLVPAPVGAQNSESRQARRPAANNNRQSAPQKAAPARPARQAPMRPVQRPPGTARGGVTTGTRPNNAGTVGGGRSTGTRSNNAGAVGGGRNIGTRSNNAGTAGGGRSAGTRSNNAGAVGGRSAGARSNNAGAVGGGRSTGTRSNNAGAARGRGGITGNNRTVRQRPVYVPGRNVQTTTNADGTKRHYNPQTQTAIHTDRSGHVAAVERPGLRATQL